MFYINSSTKAGLPSRESVCRSGGAGPRSVLAPPRAESARGAFKELSDWNLFTAKQRLSHRGQPVRGVVRSIVLKLFHARAELLVGVVLVVGDVQAEDIEQRNERNPGAGCLA